MFRNSHSKRARRKLLGERFEPRICLSAIGFSTHEIIATDAYRPFSVHVADLDRDGDLDVVSASTDDKIAWYENTDGKGSFGPQRVISTETDLPRWVHAADLDGDGDLDVLSASENDDKIAWYENTDGKGHFGPQQVITSVADGANTVHTGDIDGDGDLDVLSASVNDDKIAWYENTDGKGSFGPQQVINAAPDGAYSAYLDDLDGDGDLDVLFASWQDDKIGWYENTDGTGVFGPQQVITTAADGAAAVCTGDVDGDGDLDVLSASWSDDKIAWYENTDGAGSFGPQQVITITEDGVRSLFAGDLDGDGDLDVLAGCWQMAGKVSWYENTDGLGHFELRQVILAPTEGAWSVYAGDLDGDGDLDALSATLSDSTIAWYENTDGVGSFGPQRAITTPAVRASSVSTGDLDGDGDQDVVAALADDGHKVVWYENTDGIGAFAPKQVVAATSSYSVCVGDLDGDGDLDLLSASNSDYTIAWYENTDGAGHFGPPQVIATIEGGSLILGSITAVDIDGDGDLDVLRGSKFDYEITWYENTNGLGSFGPQQSIAAEAETGLAFMADLDGDGDLDLLAGRDGGYRINWYQNTDGLGTFGSPQLITTAASTTGDVYAGDVDGDGDLDVLSAGRTISWYENTDGFGTFGPQQVIATITTAGAFGVKVRVADLDHDGDLDVLSASVEIEWYENKDGLGTFAPKQVIATTSSSVNSICVGDLDLDGDLDALSATAEGVTWHENLFSHPGDANRDGRFDTADLVQVLQAGEYEDSIEDNSTWEEGDWNGDGDFTTSDLVLALQTGLYEVKSGMNASKIAAAVDWLFAQDPHRAPQRSYVA